MTRVFSARSSDDEHMHLFEVAHWIALGLMPDPGYRMDRDKIMDMHGAQWTPTLWLTEAEVAMFSPAFRLKSICIFGKSA
ncbi:MAG: hypothetical protein JWS10_3069 [Cypionkella sp.]|nr:hypothetical protein [Cypionkella sp.]